MRSPSTRIRTERRRTAWAVAGSTALLGVAAAWAFMPPADEAVRAIQRAPIAAAATIAASARTTSLDASAFDRVLWSAPRGTSSHVAPLDARPTLPPLSLVAITRDSGALVAAVQHHGNGRLLVVADGDEIDGFTAHVGQHALLLTRADERHELKLTRRDADGR